MTKKGQVHKRVVPLFMKEVFETYENKNIRLTQALEILGVRRSNFFRYLKKYRQNPSGFNLFYVRKSINRKLSKQENETIKEILKEEKDLLDSPKVKIAKFNFAALSEELEREKNISVSPETIRKRAIASGLHRPNQKKARIYREVESRKIGRLFQHDTCYHQWSPYMRHFYLILTVDDCSRRIVCAQFFTKETSMNHILCLRDTITKHGIPLSYYTDRHSIFTFNLNRGFLKSTKIEAVDAEAQWAKVMEKLQIQHILARSPEAKGKVESKFKYLQARLVRRCWKEEVTTLAHAQRILDEEVKYYNECRKHAVTGLTPKEKWGLAEKENQKLLRPLILEEEQSWKDIFCLEYEKKLDKYGKTKVKGIEIQLKSSPSKDVLVRYIADTNKRELRIYAKNVLLKVIIL